ncbi:MAG: hypothetical protein HQM08_25220 [Candidatus Riflebacteria bacterium]|nr:hypothetical protein [Candidatus Riflebacteria bacterium]
MHPNLLKIQSLVIHGIKEVRSMEMARIHHPELVATLVMAEKPLTVKEIVQRAEVSQDEAEKFVFHMLDKGIVAQASLIDSEGSRAYEMVGDIDEVLGAVMKSRIDQFVDQLEQKLSEAERLLESSRSEFDSFDFLYSRIVETKLRRLRKFNSLLQRRSQIWDFFQEAGPKNIQSPKRVEIK